jgi:hypothetical protein
MKRIKLEVTFIGKDGSHGFKHGCKYNITLTLNRNGSVLIEDITKQCIPCLYSDIMTFFKNWNNIIHL